MHEPKYKLNKIDEDRWQRLVARHVVGKRVPLAERVEFEKLQAKRRQKRNSHPRMRAHTAADRRHLAWCAALLRRARRVLARLKKRATM